ncbi:MAG: hypothetical protein NT069_01220, partial [Planctomycetota bacterium]|nr:hypothetical protein [Planctomycetota bacterium]
YLGLGAFVEVDYTEPDIKYTLIDLSSTNDPDTGDIYSGLDRFSRIKDCRWYNYGTSTDAVRIKHGYDRAGNRLYREDPVAASYGKAFDELYAYDRTYRLIDMQRGTLNGSKTRITGGSKTFEQCWTLDATGNWQGFREDSDGNSSWDLVQARSDNKVNEITGVTNSVGSAWTAPAYNRNGNMTTVPQPADPTKGFSATYDAWNWLVKLVDVPTDQTVQENAYDGRTFRVVRKSYTSGVLSETRQLFYSTGWQVVEERVGAATAAERQFVWGLRYLDDLIVRDRDTTGGGSLIERLYALQDANWNVMAISNSAGVTQERYAYSSYVTPVVSTGTIGTRSSSSYLWEVLYGGYRSDSSSDLYSNRHRTYVPLAGIWLARDLIVYSGEDFNLYQYCQSAPQMFVDPLGLVMWPTHYYRDPDTGELIPIQVDRPHFDPSDLFPASVIVSVPLRVWRLGYLGARFFRASATPILARLAAARAALGQVSGSALGGALGTVALLANPKHFRPSMVNTTTETRYKYKNCCVTRHFRSTNPEHDYLVNFLQGNLMATLIVAPDGTPCEFDGGIPPDVFEAKSGHEWLSDHGALNSSNFIARGVKLHEQFSRCRSVAEQCGCTYSLFVDNSQALEGFRLYFGRYFDQMASVDF